MQCPLQVCIQLWAAVCMHAARALPSQVQAGAPRKLTHRARQLCSSGMWRGLRSLSHPIFSTQHQVRLLAYRQELLRHPPAGQPAAGSVMPGADSTVERSAGYAAVARRLRDSDDGDADVGEAGDGAGCAAEPASDLQVSNEVPAVCACLYQMMHG